MTETNVVFFRDQKANVAKSFLSVLQHPHEGLDGLGGLRAGRVGHSAPSEKRVQCIATYHSDYTDFLCKMYLHAIGIMNYATIKKLYLLKSLN